MKLSHISIDRDFLKIIFFVFILWVTKYHRCVRWKKNFFDIP